LFNPWPFSHPHMRAGFGCFELLGLGDQPSIAKEASRACCDGVASGGGPHRLITTGEFVIQP